MMLLRLWKDREGGGKRNGMAGAEKEDWMAGCRT